MNKIVITGFNACKQNNITGIQRVFRETMLRLDQLVANSGLNVEYAVSKNGKNKILGLDELHHIKPVVFPSKRKRFTGLWNNLFVLPKYLKKNHAVGVSIDLNPLRSHGYAAYLPDIRPAIYKHYDKFRFRVFFKRLVLPIIKKYSQTIVTNSQYQKEIITKYLKFPADRIEVIYPGWEHMRDFVSDEKIFQKIPNITPQQYYYALGSLAPHKNYRWIHEIAKRHPEQTFVVAGGKNRKVWHDSADQQDLPNVIYPGYVSDEENKALLTHCKAFLFPSKHEGFGMPPLEALACDVPVCIAKATCLPEIYGDCAHYFDPNDYNVDLDKLLTEPVVAPQELLQKYTWAKTAQQWWQIIQKLAQN